MSGRASSWWLYLLAAAFFGFYALLVSCEWHRLEPIGIRVSFSDGMVVDSVEERSAAAGAGLRATPASSRPVTW